MNAGAARTVRRKPVAAAAGCMVLAMSAYFGFAVVAGNVGQWRVAKDYVPVEATVVSSRVGSSIRGSLGGVASYAPRIAYRYQVAGREYASDRYAYMVSGFRDREAVREVLGRYPVGARITAYHDRSDPAEAVIDRRPPGLSPAVMALPFALFGLMGLILAAHGLGRVRSDGGRSVRPTASPPPRSPRAPAAPG